MGDLLALWEFIFQWVNLILSYKNHKFLQDKENKLIKLQRQLSKKQKGSNNRAKAKLKVAKAHQKITRARDDYLHKISDEITNLYDFIAVENLNIKGLIKNKHLSKSIANASWGKFINLLTYKAENKGKTLMQIDKFFPSSQICSNCGSNTGKNHCILEALLVLIVILNTIET